MSQLEFWTIALSGGFALTWLFHWLYEWQERRAERKAVDKRVRALNKRMAYPWTEPQER